MARKSTGSFDLSGRTGIITGGGGTLGRAFASALLAHGANVVLADLDEKAAVSARAAVGRRVGARVLALGCDVSDPRSVEAMVARTVERFGAIHFLLNNAATFSGAPAYYAPFEEYALAEWRRVMSVNLDGVFLVSQAVGKRMLAQRTGGSIVQISSIYGLLASDNRIYEGSSWKGHPINNPAVYSASKAGVLGLTRWLATYWSGRGIRVNAIAPGGVHSGENEAFTRRYSARVPMGRMARRDEIAGAAVYLASDASSYVTGQCLAVDGGLSAW